MDVKVFLNFEKFNRKRRLDQLVVRNPKFDGSFMVQTVINLDGWPILRLRNIIMFSNLGRDSYGNEFVHRHKNQRTTRGVYNTGWQATPLLPHNESQL